MPLREASVFALVLVTLACVEAVHFERGPSPPLLPLQHTTFPNLDAADDELGILNVAKDPYNADPSGNKDSTAAIQSAILDGRKQKKVIYLPLGTYLISDTLNCTEHSRGRFFPVVMVGETNHSDPLQRPTLYVAGNSPKFSSASQPNYVVHFWEDSSLPPDMTINSDIRTSVEFDQIFQGINIRIGRGNFGAVGIRLRGAQGSNIENALIDLGQDGFIGVVGASGSGGSHAGVTVIGGKYGLDFRMTQPAPTITGAHLVNQSCAALIYAGLQTLTAVGVFIEQHNSPLAPDMLSPITSVPPETLQPDSTPWLPSIGPCALPVLLPDGEPSGPADSGQISLIDSIIYTANAQDSAITTPRNLFMENVYIRGHRNIATFRKTGIHGPKSELPNPSETLEWALVSQAAIAIDPPETSRGSNKTRIVKLQFFSTLWKNGKQLQQNQSTVTANAPSPPTDLLSKHLWDEANFPSFQSEDAVSVKQSPYNAKGDGRHDDTEAIQRAVDANEIVLLPHGSYLVSSTLKLKASTKLVGVGRTFTSIRTPVNGLKNGAGEPMPIVETFNGPGSTVLAFLSIFNVVNTYALNWQTYGPGCYYRQGYQTTIHNGWLQNTVVEAENDQELKAAKVNATHPLVVISGGGSFYTFEVEDYSGEAPSYRHLLVTNSTHGLNFYQLNTEHSRGEANTEIRSSSQVRIFGLKSEGNYPVLWIRDSKNITLYGYGGNAAGFPLDRTYPVGYAQYTPSLFRVERCTGTRLVNLVDFPRIWGGNQTYFDGQGFNPHTWSMVLDVSNNVTTPPMQRPVLYWIP